LFKRSLCEDALPGQAWSSPAMTRNRPELRIRAMRENQSEAMLPSSICAGTFVANLFKSRRRLEVENLFLRCALQSVPSPG
jgi:hypothetical protein